MLSYYACDVVMTAQCHMPSWVMDREKAIMLSTKKKSCETDPKLKSTCILY